ncbi:SRPBCC family protein [Acidovorax sp.]|uniref:SRPBCC family protein n=1 Tax=Acidovorax sp. TaxID=1872122 RepID=UPI003CFBC68B
MASIQETLVVSQPVAVAAPTVYDFAHRMQNLPLWASGLATGIEQRDGQWYTDSPMGKVQVAMAPANPYGVLDHDVTLPDGTTVHNAFRVTPCGDKASLLSFVVLRLAGVGQADFDADVAHVRKDLATLQQLLERQAP